MKTVAVVGGVILFFALIFGITYLGDAYDVWHTGYWGPKQAAVENKVYENNTIYVQGKRENLNRLRSEYRTADAGHKAAIKEEILDEAVNVDLNKLPEDLRTFIEGLQGDGQ
jgi:hypothetical protein